METVFIGFLTGWLFLTDGFLTEKNSNCKHA
jgi:hypothetical protein